MYKLFAEGVTRIWTLRSGVIFFDTKGETKEMEKRLDFLERVNNDIDSLDKASMDEAKSRQDSLTKPKESLGKLEDLSIQIAGIKRDARPSIDKKVVIVMAGDHGVTESGVSAFPKEVTHQMVLNFAGGGAGINVLAKHVGAEVRVIDIGVDALIESDAILNKKVKMGTDNFINGPAMSREEAIKALNVGIDVVIDEVEEGADLIAIGDMGIGNTTASTAILRALSGLDIKDITGKGTGIDEEGLIRKQELILEAIEKNDPNSGDAIDVLSKLGGLEIAALAGVILGAAMSSVPVIIDGFISGAAALISAKIAPKSVEYMVASHLSVEPGHGFILRELGLDPVLDLNMRLGEGTGSALTMSIVEAACKILSEMATFEEASVSNKSEEEMVK